MTRPFAVFDIDGTLIRWQLYHALADELVRMGRLDADQFQKVREARMNWKKRTNNLSFETYEQTLIKLLDVAITGISVTDLEQAGNKVLLEYKDQVYTFTRDLIRDLAFKNYLLFAISASPSEIVGLLAAHYGFNDFGGSVYETKDGFFTGKIDLLMSEQKPIYLNQLVTKHDASWQGSIGVGDSQSDIPMLSAVELPIAFNPNKALYEQAVAKKWPIVIERKNMVYKLEYSSGSYLLA